MKKMIIPMLLFVNIQLFPQITESLSMGYNSFFRAGNNEIIYYFYGYEGYSEAILFPRSIDFETSISGWYYSFDSQGELVQYSQYQGANNSIGFFRSRTNGPGRSHPFEYKFEDNRLIYWKSPSGHSYSKYEIEQHSDRIIIHAYLLNTIRQYRYFNISRIELLDMYLRRFVEIICKFLEVAQEIIINENGPAEPFIYRMNKTYQIRDFFDGRTARELAIFRNSLFARKGYKFTSQSWIDFFNKYLDGYNGRYTNDEIMAMLNEQERWLLDLIIEYEKKL